MTARDNQTALFIIENEKVAINPKALLINEFSVIFERDRSVGKKKALREFAYIYYIADYKSEYNAYGLAKEEQLGLDIFGKKNYKPDSEIQDAIDKYMILQKTPSMQYLQSIRNRVDRLIKFLDSAEIVEKNGDGTYKNPYLTIDKVTKVLNELEDVMEKLEKWEKKVFDEEENMQIRGGGMLNAFENPEDAKWMIKN